MAVNSSITFSSIPSTSVLLRHLGAQLRQMRLNKNLTQKELAEVAGLARSTISKLENDGDATLSTLVQVLRALDKLEILNHFITEAPVSPLQIAKLKGKARQRASGDRISKNNDKQKESEW